VERWRPCHYNVHKATVMNLQEDDMPKNRLAMSNFNSNQKGGCLVGARPRTRPCSFTQATWRCQDLVWMMHEYA
jgi:hypothetical protein